MTPEWPTPDSGPAHPMSWYEREYVSFDHALTTITQANVFVVGFREGMVRLLADYGGRLEAIGCDVRAGERVMIAGLELCYPEIYPSSSVREWEEMSPLLVEMEGWSDDVEYTSRLGGGKFGLTIMIDDQGAQLPILTMGEMMLPMPIYLDHWSMGHSDTRGRVGMERYGRLRRRELIKITAEAMSRMIDPEVSVELDCLWEEESSFFTDPFFLRASTCTIGRSMTTMEAVEIGRKEYDDFFGWGEGLVRPVYYIVGGEGDSRASELFENVRMNCEGWKAEWPLSTGSRGESQAGKIDQDLWKSWTHDRLIEEMLSMSVMHGLGVIADYRGRIEGIEQHDTSNQAMHMAMTMMAFLRRYQILTVQEAKAERLQNEEDLRVWNKEKDNEGRKSDLDPDDCWYGY